MGKDAGQGGLREKLGAVLEFGVRRPCDLCGVKVFRRWYYTVEGTVPRHRRRRACRARATLHWPDRAALLLSVLPLSR
jgi:hypothetical protein